MFLSRDYSLTGMLAIMKYATVDASIAPEGLLEVISKVVTQARRLVFRCMWGGSQGQSMRVSSPTLCLMILSLVSSMRVTS